MRCYHSNTEEEEKESGDEVCEIYRLRSCKLYRAFSLYLRKNEKPLKDIKRRVTC